MFGVVACGDSSETKLSSGEERGTTKLLVEEPSELALLMRGMKQQSISLKAALEKGDSLNFEILEEWKRIHSAAPTEEGKKTPIYHGFADAFLSSVDTLKLVTVNKKQYYNMMISACVDCHSELCPGPVSTIQKLKINQ